MYLNDDPNNMANYQYAEKIAQTAEALRQQVEFVGLHWDQEPSKKDAYYDLLSMLQLSARHIHTSSTIKPLWLRQSVQECLTSDEILQLDIKNTGQSLAQALCEICHSGALMAYSNDYEQVSAFMKQASEISSAVGKNCVSIVETGFTNDLPEDETLCYEFRKDPSAFYKYVADRSAQYSTVAIHDYAQFYYDLYCEDPSKQAEMKSVC